jgi:hypothetical protein
MLLSLASRSILLTLCASALNLLRSSSSDCAWDAPPHQVGLSENGSLDAPPENALVDLALVVALALDLERGLGAAARVLAAVRGRLLERTRVALRDLDLVVAFLGPACAMPFHACRPFWAAMNPKGITRLDRLPPDWSLRMMFFTA